MFKWYAKIKHAAQRAEIDLLRREVAKDVLTQLQGVLSMAPTNDRGQPNLSPFHAAIRNVDLASLNLKFYGYDLARKLAAAIPPRTDTTACHVGLQSKASTQADMESEWVAHWCSQLLTPVIFHRKMWELSYVLQAIHEGGHMRAGARGLGFGCGVEAIPSYLAAHGVAVTITDLDAGKAQAAGWAATNQHAASLDQAFQPQMLDRATFDQLVQLEIVDMNAIPAHLQHYDFCWSICALEHLGSIANGLAFIENSLATLRPGGLSVHTTEFNINPTGPTIDNWPTVLFQGHHFNALAERLRGQGHEVAELNFDLGDKPMDQFIDLPPWAHDLPEQLSRWVTDGPHLKVAVDGFASTCFGVIVKKAS